MHTVIQQRRRELGLTQEQVADHLGVTAPAVSKWETGATSPDIGLLPSLARLLKTDLNTLFSFHEALTPQEISAFCETLTLAARESLASAFSLAEEKLRQFPHSGELLLNVTILLEAMVLQWGLNAEKAAPFEEKLTAWYGHLMESADSSIRSSAGYMVVNRYIRQGRLDQAQAALDAIEEKSKVTAVLPDKLTLQVSIYLKENKAGLAALELEKALYQDLCRVQLLLTQLVEAEHACGEQQAAKDIAHRALGMTELFGLWRYTGYTGLFHLAAAEQDAEKALGILDPMLEALTVPWDFAASPLFSRMAPEMKQANTREILSLLLRNLETDPNCAYLREAPGFSALLSKFK